MKNVAPAFRLSEVRPQERAQRRTVQQIVDPVPLPTLDDPAPQMVGKLLNLAHFLDTPLPDPEQVIEVPKILSDDVPMRALARETQLAEQLVEVPTIISYSSLQRDCGAERRHSSSWWWWCARSSRFFPQDRVQQRLLSLWNAFLSGLWNRTSKSLLVEVFKIFSQDRAHLHLLHLQLVFVVLQMYLEKGFFRTFPQIKKSAKLGSHSGSELLPESSPSTPAAHVDALSGVELLAEFQQLSDQVENTKRSFFIQLEGVLE